MSIFNTGDVDLTIPINTDVSNIIKAREVYDDAASISLLAPATLDGVTFTLQVTDDFDATTSSTWRTLQVNDPPTDINPPAAGKARTYYDLPTYAAFRIKASGNVAAARTWALIKNSPHNT